MARDKDAGLAILSYDRINIQNDDGDVSNGERVGEQRSYARGS